MQQARLAVCWYTGVALLLHGDAAIQVHHTTLRVHCGTGSCSGVIEKDGGRHEKRQSTRQHKHGDVRKQRRCTELKQSLLERDMNIECEQAMGDTACRTSHHLQGQLRH
jgi:hypothetical protein